MSWYHRPGRMWHYQVPGSDRLVCGSFFVVERIDERVAVPPVGHTICKRCERLFLHAWTGALHYTGQSTSRKAISEIEFRRRG